MLKLWLVSRTDSIGYDEYDAIVVAADSEEKARSTHPEDYVTLGEDGKWYWASGVMSGSEYPNRSWVSPDTLSVTYLGVADESVSEGVKVVLSSFNAG